jgi:hypothetical protein
MSGGLFPLENETESPEAANRKRLDSLREAFENDDPAEPAMQTALENAAPLFEAGELATLEFQQADCRSNYCRLVYRDQSPNSAESAIAENELSLLLAEKYGQGITIKGGEHRGNVRVIYIEFPAQ